MGVKGLLKLVYPYMERVNVSKWAHKRVAVDASAWLQQMLKNPGSDSESVRNSSSREDRPCFKHLYSCMQRIRTLVLKYHVKLVLVFEGAPLPCKRGTSHSKHPFQASKGVLPGIDTHDEKPKGLSLDNTEINQAIGLDEEAVPQFDTSLSVLQQEAYELRHLIQSNDELKGHVECITAPYEANAQIAYLCRTQYTDLAVGDDSNLIIYGAPKILFKMDSKGEGMLLNVETLVTEKIYDNGQRLIDWSPALLLGIAALAGCDYIRPLPSIDLIKVLAYLAAFGGGVEGALKPLLDASGVSDTHLDGIVKSLGLSLLNNSQTSVPVKKKKGSSKETISSFSRFTCYRAAVYRCRLIYLYQRVYDPLSKCCRFGRDLPASPAHLAQFAILAHFDARLLRSETNGDTTVLQKELGRALLGPEISDKSAQDIAEGKLNPCTMQPFPSPQLIPKKYRVLQSAEDLETNALLLQTDELEEDEQANSVHNYEEAPAYKSERQCGEAVSPSAKRGPEGFSHTLTEKHELHTSNSCHSKISKSLLQATSVLGSYKNSTSEPKWISSKPSSQNLGARSKKLSEISKDSEITTEVQQNIEQYPRKNSWLQNISQLSTAQSDESRTQLRKRLRQANPRVSSPEKSEPSRDPRLVQTSHQIHVNSRRMQPYLEDDSNDYCDDEAEEGDWLSIEMTSQRSVYLRQLSRLIREISSEQVPAQESKGKASSIESEKEIDPSHAIESKITISSPIPKWIKRSRVPSSAPLSRSRSHVEATSSFNIRKPESYKNVSQHQPLNEESAHLSSISGSRYDEDLKKTNFKVRSFISPIISRTQHYDTGIIGTTLKEGFGVDSEFLNSPRGMSIRSRFPSFENRTIAAVILNEDSSLFRLKSPSPTRRSVDKRYKLTSQEF